MKKLVLIVALVAACLIPAVAEASPTKAQGARAIMNSGQNICNNVDDCHYAAVANVRRDCRKGRTYVLCALNWYFNDGSVCWDIGTAYFRGSYVRRVRFEGDPECDGGDDLSGYGYY